MSEMQSAFFDDQRWPALLAQTMRRTCPCGTLPEAPAQGGIGFTLPGQG